jgi:hypothetical protein
MENLEISAILNEQNNLQYYLDLACIFMRFRYIATFLFSCNSVFRAAEER